MLWGSTGINPREKNFVEYLVSSNLNIPSQGNELTFVVCNRKEVVDLILVANKIGSLVSKWYVLGEPSLSDHRCICFEVGNRYNSSYF
jgi:hypothetical protein